MFAKCRFMSGVQYSLFLGRPLGFDALSSFCYPKVTSQFPFFISRCLLCWSHHLSGSSPNSKSQPFTAGKYSYSNQSSSLQDSSKSSKPSFRAYKKRVNRRLRLLNKPILDEARFNNALSQLPARFTADDLYSIIALEDDPLVCVELFHWSSKLPRFKHSSNTFLVTVQKLGVAGMMDQMYDVVNQLLVHPHFGSQLLYNTIISYFTKARKLSKAIAVFKHMKNVNNSECRPSIKTYNLLFAALLSRGKNTYINHMYMGTMESLFRQMLNDKIMPDIFSLNSMIKGYVLSNHVNNALRIFHQMATVYSCNPDSVTYDQLIHGLCAQGRTNNARELYNDMKGHGFLPSAVTYNSLVNALALGGELDEGVTFLWEMIQKQRPADFITYKTILDEFCRKGRVVEALKLVEEFKRKRLVDDLTYKKLFYVCHRK